MGDTELISIQAEGRKRWAWGVGQKLKEEGQRAGAMPPPLQEDGANVSFLPTPSCWGWEGKPPVESEPHTPHLSPSTWCSVHPQAVAVEEVRREGAAPDPGLNVKSRFVPGADVLR